MADCTLQTLCRMGPQADVSFSFPSQNPGNLAMMGPWTSPKSTHWVTDLGPAPFECRTALYMYAGSLARLNTALRDIPGPQDAVNGSEDATQDIY